MNTLKRTESCLFACVFGVFSLLTITCLGWSQTLYEPKAEQASYSLGFSSSVNAFPTNETINTIQTRLGNAITFSYSGYSEIADGWGGISSGGHVSNKTAISGLLSLSVTFKNDSGQLSVSYGWLDSSSNAVVYYDGGTINSSSPSCDFGSNSPSYFKISASSQTDIETMTINYSCSASSNPWQTSLNALTISGIFVNDCETSAVSVVVPCEYKDTSITILSASAFKDCGLLTSISLPSTITDIRNLAFSGCTQLASMEIPSSVTSIGECAFVNCSSLNTIVIPSSVTQLGEEVFWNCTSLVSVVLPDSMTAIPYGLFIGCSSLASISIPSSVTSIDDWAFGDCSSLASVIIPSSVTSIDESAFRRCTSLKTIVIPSSVTQVKFYSFGGCSSLSIYCEAVSTPSGWDSSWNPDSRPTYYYSSTESAGYWRYVAGVPTLW